jgi:hypothetical protein
MIKLETTREVAKLCLVETVPELTPAELDNVAGELSWLPMPRLIESSTP